jgi:hypothetical protein
MTPSPSRERAGVRVIQTISPHPRIKSGAGSNLLPEGRRDIVAEYISGTGTERKW